jgi:hypothetical protein
VNDPFEPPPDRQQDLLAPGVVQEHQPARQNEANEQYPADGQAGGNQVQPTGNNYEKCHVICHLSLVICHWYRRSRIILQMTNDQ